jgi:hypothetical protein
VGFTNQQAWDIICSTSDKVNYVKHGRINAWKAISAIEQFAIVAKDPTAVSMMIGTKMTGGIPQVIKKDSKVLIVNSAMQSATGSTTGVVLEYTISEPLSAFVDPQLHLVSKTDIPSTLMVFLYNNQTKKWDFIRSAGSKNTASELFAVLPEAMGNYMTAQGKIKALVRTHVPITRGRTVSSYRLQLDQAVFEGKVKIN